MTTRACDLVVLQFPIAQAAQRKFSRHNNEETFPKPGRGECGSRTGREEEPRSPEKLRLMPGFKTPSF